MGTEYVHYVRILEFQSWNNVKGEEQHPFLVGVSDPYNADDDATIVPKFYEKCMYAALGKCDEVIVRAVDEEGNVWHGLEQRIRIVRKPEAEE